MEDKGLEAPPPKDEDPDGSKLLTCSDPLEQAWKFLQPLLEMMDSEVRSEQVESIKADLGVWVAVYDVAVRRGQHALCGSKGRNTHGYLWYRREVATSCKSTERRESARPGECGSSLPDYSLPQNLYAFPFLLLFHPLPSLVLSLTTPTDRLIILSIPRPYRRPYCLVNTHNPPARLPIPRILQLRLPSTPSIRSSSDPRFRERLSDSRSSFGRSRRRSLRGIRA